MGTDRDRNGTGTRAKAVKRNRGQRKEINPVKGRQQEQGQKQGLNGAKAGNRDSDRGKGR
jgi:hypothetical protein